MSLFMMKNKEIEPIEPPRVDFLRRNSTAHVYAVKPDAMDDG